jgi:hypothetical protein
MDCINALKDILSINLSVKKTFLLNDSIFQFMISVKKCFLLATYGIWVKDWFSVEKNENFLLLIFHLGLLWLKDMIWTKKKLRLSRAVVGKFVSRLQPPPQKLERLNFGSRCFLDQFDATWYSEFR